MIDISILTKSCSGEWDSASSWLPSDDDLSHKARRQTSSGVPHHKTPGIKLILDIHYLISEIVRLRSLSAEESELNCVMMMKMVMMILLCNAWGSGSICPCCWSCSYPPCRTHRSSSSFLWFLVVGDFITMWHQIFVFIVDIYSVSSSDLTLKSGVLVLAANCAAEPQQLKPEPWQCNVM